MDWNSCIETPAIMPGIAADFNLTLVLGMNMYNTVNATDKSKYGDNFIAKDISGPNTIMSFN